MFKKAIKGVVLGAVIGTLIGSASIFFSPKRKKLLKNLKNQTNNWMNQAKSVSNTAFDELHDWTEPKEITRKKFFRGAFIGLLLGAGSALLLAPKSGQQLRQDLTKKYQNFNKKSFEIASFLNNSHKNPASSKTHRARAMVKKVIGRTQK